MSNDSIGAPVHSNPVATPAERLIYASEVLLDFQSGTKIQPDGRTIGNVPPEDSAWAAEMGQAQQAKGERPAHPDEEIEASLRAGQAAKEMEG